jgi:hypothetical protein
MAAEWLRAEQVAAMEHRAVLWALRSDPARGEACALILDDLPSLVAQDGRWRALVGRMKPYLAHRRGCTHWTPQTAEVCTCRVHDVWLAAQAALDGAE